MQSHRQTPIITSGESTEKVFEKIESDNLADNAIYSLCEKTIQDYFATLDWEIIDGKKNQVNSVI